MTMVAYNIKGNSAMQIIANKHFLGQREGGLNSTRKCYDSSGVGGHEMRVHGASGSPSSIARYNWLHLYNVIDPHAQRLQLYQ